MPLAMIFSNGRLEPLDGSLLRVPSNRSLRGSGPTVSSTNVPSTCGLGDSGSTAPGNRSAIVPSNYRLGPSGGWLLRFI
jgi:hypothetical protein